MPWPRKPANGPAQNAVVASARSSRRCSGPPQVTCGTQAPRGSSARRGRPKRRAGRKGDRLGFVEAFHTLATLAFVGGSAVVAVRLLLLARRTRQEPERLLGAAILCAAVLGYGVLIANLLVRGARPGADAPMLGVFLSGAG